MINFWNGILFIFFDIFLLFSMYKNDSVSTSNRWLRNMAFCVLGILIWVTITSFIRYGVYIGRFRGTNLTDKIRQPITDYFLMGIAGFLGLYFFSLRKKCMESQYLPRTLKIFIRRRWHRFLYKKAKPSTCCQNLDKIVFQ